MRYEVYPLTDYHIFAEAMNIQDLTVYRPAVRTEDGGFAFVTDNPLVNEHQNAFSDRWVHDFVLKQNGNFFSPQDASWIKRTTPRETLASFGRTHELLREYGEVFLVRTTPVPSGRNWQQFEYEHRIVDNLTQ